MVQVRVAGVALDAAQDYVILLKPVAELPGQGQVLPIWIGEQEATAILIAIEGAAVPRPLAHDLMRRMLEATETTVEKVTVARIEEGTFYAEITLATPAGVRIVDARPSDSVALACRVDAPIWVADAVMADASIPDPMDDADNAQRLAEFKRFLDDVDPDDFRS